MKLRSGMLLVAMTLVAGGLAAFGFAGSAYALTTPSISTTQQPGSSVVGSSIADKATVSGSASAFVCPSQDNAGFPLGTSNTATNPIFCSYPAFSGENPTDFYCEYSATTGVLVTDHDAGFCPSSAAGGGASPTGTVTFKLYNNSSGSGSPLFTDTKSLVSGVATSAGYTVTGTGTDYWVATYNGDVNFNPVTSSNSGEPVSITPSSPSLSGSGGGSGTVGSPISDSAIISGGYSPHGSISFSLFPGSSCTGTQIGSSTMVAVSGDKTYPSGAIATPTGAGMYSVSVSYAPDANNSAPPKVCDPYSVQATTPTPTCKVPNLAGKKLKAVRKALRKADCKLGTVTKEGGATRKSGKVKKQSPKAGKVLAPGSEVMVTLKP